MCPVMKALLLLTCVMFAEAGRIRHRESKALNAGPEPTILWNVTGFYPTFPSATFPSIRTAIALNFSDSLRHDASVVSINLHSGHVDWTRAITTTDWIVRYDGITASRNYEEFYYLTRYQRAAEGGNRCVETTGWKLRATTPNWQQRSCYNVKASPASLESTLFLYNIKGSEILLRVDVTSAACSVVGLDGQLGTELYRLNNITCSGFVNAEHHGHDDSPLLVIHQDDAKTLTVYNVTDKALTQVNVVPWGDNFEPLGFLYDVASVRGGSIFLECIAFQYNIWRGIDLLTNQTIWSSDNVKNPLIDGSWASGYPGYKVQIPKPQVNPLNPNELLLVAIAGDAYKDLAVMQAGVMDVDTGLLNATSSVFEHLLDPSPEWFRTSKNELVLSVNDGGNKWYWYGFTSNLSLIGTGMLPYIPDPIEAVLDVSATSVTVVTDKAVNKWYGVQAVRFESTNSTMG